MPYNAETRRKNAETRRQNLEKKIAGNKVWALSIKEFCAAIGISIAKFYLLAEDEKPKTIKLTGRVLVIESPHDYLNRMLEQQS